MNFDVESGCCCRANGLVILGEAAGATGGGAGSGITGGAAFQPAEVFASLLEGCPIAGHEGALLFAAGCGAAKPAVQLGSSEDGMVACTGAGGVAGVAGTAEVSPKSSASSPQRSASGILPLATVGATGTGTGTGIGGGPGVVGAPQLFVIGCG
jgi:hypothetical protein